MDQQKVMIVQNLKNQEKGKKKKKQKKFEKDLALLLNGKVDEYISKNMPMDIPAMSPKGDSNDILAREIMNRDELRPRSLSIEIKNAEYLRKRIGDKQEESEDDEEPNNNINNNNNDKSPNNENQDEKELYETPKDNAQTEARTRNRKLDRILRGSNSNLEYTKKVLGMVENERHTPSTNDNNKTKRDKSPNALYNEANQLEKRRRDSKPII